ncbi:hypothetical protein NKH77_09305 [Streptomyces sp. M19]
MIAVTGCAGRARRDAVAHPTRAADWDAGPGRGARAGGRRRTARFTVALPERAGLTRSRVNVSVEPGAEGGVRRPAWTAGWDDTSPVYTLFSVPAACPSTPRSTPGRSTAATRPTAPPPTCRPRWRGARTGCAPAGAGARLHAAVHRVHQSCAYFDEPFAVITLDRPADRAHPPSWSPPPAASWTRHG